MQVGVGEAKPTHKSTTTDRRRAPVMPLLANPVPFSNTQKVIRCGPSSKADAQLPRNGRSSVRMRLSALASGALLQ